MLSFEVENQAPDSDTIIVDISDTTHDQMRITIYREDGDTFVIVEKGSDALGYVLGEEG